MRMAPVLAALAALACIVSASAQDFGFDIRPLEKATRDRLGLTNRGVTGAINTAGLLGTAARLALPNSVIEPLSIRVGRFNADTIDDIAYVGADGSGATLTILLGAGDGTFGSPQVIALTTGPASAGAVAGVPSGPLEAFAGDAGASSGFALSLDGSVLSGLIAANPGDTVHAPSLALDGPPEAAAAGALSAAGSGYAVVVPPNSLIAVAEQGLAAAVTLPITALPANARQMIALGVGNLTDLADPEATVDGDVDVFVATGADGVLCFEGELTPTGAELEPPNFSLTLVGGVAGFEGSNLVHVVDFNNDGIPDVAAASTRDSTFGIAMATTNGPGYDPPFQVYLSGAPRSFAVGHFNSDSLPDVVVAFDAGVQVLLYDGGWGFTPGPVINAEGDLPLRDIRSVAVGRFDPASTTEDLVIAVGPDEESGQPGGVLLLSAAKGYAPIPVPIRTKAFHPCFELLAAALLERDAALVEPLDAEGTVLKKAIAKALAALQKPSTALATDLVTASVVIKALAKAFADDTELIEILAEALDCAAAAVRDDRDALAEAIEGLPGSKPLAKANAALAKCDAFLAAAGTAANQAAIAKALQKALKQVASGAKQAAKVPSFVVAMQDLIPFASDFLDFNYATGGSLSLFADDFSETVEANFTEINLNLTGISGPGTYNLGAFPAPNRAYVARNGPQCGFNCPRWDAVSGTVTITSDDPVARVLDGTFSFTAERISGAGGFTTSVQSGKFHLRY